MSRACELLVTTRNGQVVAGTITLDDDQVSGKANAGFKVLVDDVLDSDKAGDVTAWFDNLPKFYHGSYLRARMVDADKVAKYSDDQPRVPAGSPAGGQFAGGDAFKQPAVAQAVAVWTKGGQVPIQEKAAELVRSGAPIDPNAGPAAAILYGIKHGEPVGSMFRGLKIPFDDPKFEATYGKKMDEILNVIPGDVFQVPEPQSFSTDVKTASSYMSCTHCDHVLIEVKQGSGFNIGARTSHAGNEYEVVSNGKFEVLDIREEDGSRYHVEGEVHHITVRQIATLGKQAAAYDPSIREIYLGRDRMVPKAGKVSKYSDDQPRDENGQWTSGGASGVVAHLNEKYPVNPANPAERLLVVGGKRVGSFEVIEREGRLRIRSIVADQPGQSVGSLILGRITRAADKAGVTVELTASSKGSHFLDTDQLKQARRHRSKPAPLDAAIAPRQGSHRAQNARAVQ